ncbi:MAG: redoxin domain-containing protein [Gammaproteobacteria bacterium]|jgi:peroxiredoxin
MSQSSKVANATPVSTLAEQTAKVRDEFIASQPDEDKAIIGAAMEKLMASDFGARALNVGDRIPHFTLPNASGEPVAIADYIAKGPVVLSFYRGGWCPFCNLEFKALSEALPAIRERGATLIGVSPELPDVAQQTVSQHNIPFEVLSDVGNEVIKQFGLLTYVYEEMRPLYLKWGLDVPAHNGDERWEMPIPATYVIDEQGVIRAGYVNKDYTQRMEPAEIIDALDKL